MIGYKVAKNGNTRVLLTLEIPQNALTNLTRSDIKNPHTAKYRCNKVKVLKIEDDDGALYNTAETLCFKGKSLTYRLGKVVEEPEFDLDLEKVCSTGIHFFLSREVTNQYERKRPMNGLFQSWYDNGQMCEEVMYKDGKYDGLYQNWYENCQKHEEILYKDMKRHGLYQSWHKNGQMGNKVMYKDGERDGLYQSWYENGQKCEEIVYKNGNCNGLYQSWHDNGQKSKEVVYKNWKVDGLYQSWYRDGQKCKDVMYKDGGPEISCCVIV